jgi:transcriptional regulator NrdR family protein
VTDLSQKPLKANEIINDTLRRIVLRKVAQTLSKNGFDEAKSKKLAILCEARLRECDNTMGDRYKALYRQMM